MSTIAELKATLPQVGRVEWIGISSERLAPLRAVAKAPLRPGRGIDGEHHAKGRGVSKRQVTLIQSEHLAAVASLVGRDRVPFELVR